MTGCAARFGFLRQQQQELGAHAGQGDSPMVAVLRGVMTEEAGANTGTREEEALAHLAAIVDSSDDAILSKTPDGVVTTWNRAAEKLYGYRAEEVIGRHISFLVPAARMDELKQVTERILRGEQVKNLETVSISKQGREVQVSLTISPIRTANGTIAGVSSIARDISKRIEMERLLRESEQRYRTLVEMAPDAVFVHEPDGRFVYANCAALGIYGVRTVEQLQQSTLLDLVHPDDRDSMITRIRQLLNGEEISPGEYRLIRLDGIEVPVESSASLIEYQGRPSIQMIARDVTGRKQTEREREIMLKELADAAKALSESEERLNLALDAAEMGSCDIEVQTGAGIWSRRHFLLMGYPPPEGESGPASIDMWQGRIHPEDLEQVLHTLEQAHREHALFRSEHRILRADNNEAVWVDVLGRFLCDPAGAACRFIGVIFDATERKGTEDALRRSAQRFRLMADSMPQIVWTANPDGSIDYINAYFESYTGIDREAERAKLSRAESAIPFIIHPDDAEETAKAWLHAVASGERYQHEARIRRWDGAYRWHLSRATAERDDEGEVVMWYGTSTDIHELRETQEKLRASETKFRRLYESNLVAIFFWNKDGRITEANQAYCDLAGYSAEECRQGGLSWLDVTAPDCFDRDFSAMEEIMSLGICKPYEKVYINRASGDRVYVLTAIAKMAGSEAEGIGFAVDLTELKRAEKALKKSEATLKLAIETTGLGIFDLNLLTGKGDWSDIAKGHYGLPPEAEADLGTVMAGVHPEDRERIERIATDAARPGGNGVYGAQYRTVGLADGELRWLTMRGRVLYNAEGVPVRLVGACLNITDLVQAQAALQEEMTERLRAVEELRKQEQLLIRQGRLAAMGEMIGNIAHQWRQPLNTLGLIVQELPIYFEHNLLTREYLDASVTRAMQVINYMSKTIDGFRNFFGPDKEMQTFLAGEVLEKTVSILDAAFEELKLKIDVSADREAVIYGCPNEYSQVILNILVNAKDAILERRVANPRIAVRLFREEGRSVLTITDNAGGIPADIMDRIFDPYFTTKGPDRGTGIGLFMSKTIIEKNMNGKLTVRNTDDGAQFRIEV